MRLSRTLCGIGGGGTEDRVLTFCQAPRPPGPGRGVVAGGRAQRGGVIVTAGGGGLHKE